MLLGIASPSVGVARRQHYLRLCKPPMMPPISRSSLIPPVPISPTILTATLPVRRIPLGQPSTLGMLETVWSESAVQTSRQVSYMTHYDEERAKPRSEK